MNETENYLLRFWAKTSNDHINKPNAFHPLICHLIDVACVAQLMWREVLPQATQKRIAGALGLENDSESKNNYEQTGKIVAFIAGLHDLGKCSPPFTLRGLNELPSGETRRLIELYKDTPFIQLNGRKPKLAKEVPHGFVTAIELPQILKEQFGFPNNMAKQIGLLIGGHHGTFPTSKDTKREESKVGNFAWVEARQNLVLELAHHFRISKENTAVKDVELERTEADGTAMILAGLVSVADWIGSNSSYFPCKIDDFKNLEQINFQNIEEFRKYLDDYFSDSKTKAKDALTELGWIGWSKIEGERAIFDLFPDLKRYGLRDLQNKAEKEINDNLQKEAGVVVVEAPTGEGKTEAAIYLADYFNVKLNQNGIYFALPTMATSNQMYGRVKKYLKARFPDGKVTLQLNHGKATIDADFEIALKEGAKLLNLNDVYSEEKGHDECTSAVVAAEWFTAKKKGLLAPFGVGTIDQALLAALQTRHVFVRLFGLSQKTVIVDEVHAYDAYMSTLLERLLFWLAALGSPVILLSATLPKEKRIRLIEEYCKGLSITDSDIVERIKTDETEYPRISWATKTNSGVVPLVTSELNKRTLHLQHLQGFLSDETKINELAFRLKEALKNGGCAAVICNTVKRAQMVYKKLQTYLTDANNFSGSEKVWTKEEIDLLHARFLFNERQKREKRALARFGKEDEKVRVSESEDEQAVTVERPTRAILVATQIIEQSLDLDFDLMVTDLAPIDLIIQRAGRLRRHERSNRALSFQEKEKSQLWIMQPEVDENGLPIWDTKTNKKPFIYDEHILFRTWLELVIIQDRKRVKIPFDVEDLIEAVYRSQEEPLKILNEAQKFFWRKTLKEFEAGEESEEVEARNRWIGMPGVEDRELYQIIGKKEDQFTEESLAKSVSLTRNNALSLSLVCLYGNKERAFLDEKRQHQIDVQNVVFSRKKSEAEQETVKKITKQLLENSVSIIRKDVILAVLADPETRLPKWEKNPWLKPCRVLFLDDNSSAEIGDFSICLDKKLGMTVSDLND